jgi:uncharacterized protein (TIGR03435 family)
MGLRELSVTAAGIAVIAGIALPVGAQPQFDVATVKQSPPPVGDSIIINLGTVRNGKVTLTNTTLSECIRFAYGLVSEDQVSGPDWIKFREVRFDIVAQAPPDTPREQLLVMLQALLAERLKLALHHEPRERSFLALVVGKNGSKLHAAKADASPVGGPSILGRVVSNHMSMPVLASLVSRFERQIVVDMTGLTGLFEVDLQWTSERGGAPAEDVGAQATDEKPSIFVALQEQLGLKLEARKGPLDVLVVDFAQKVPSDN